MDDKNLQKNLNEFVPNNIIQALNICSQAADEIFLPIFLIGGVVRDLIIGIPNFDTDITVQGNAIDFAYFLEKNFADTCKIKEIHENFGTAKVIFTINNEKIDLDIASTRKESYPYPGSLPLVEEIGCELIEDVKRRDFTINSMALSINKKNYGELTDYLGGYDDIQRKTIRILHEKSFIDDPTRIIRALKFRVRFGYELDENTKLLQDKCLESKMFDNFCGERIKSELKQTFNLNKPEIMDIFIGENIFRLVDTEITASKDLSKTCKTIILEYLNFINPDYIWLIYLGAMFSGFSREKIGQLVQKLYLSGNETEIILDSKLLMEKSCSFDTNFRIYEFFESISPEAIVIFIIHNPEVKEKADFFLKKLKDTKIHSTGQTLIDYGLKPGPAFGEILRELLKAKINGEFCSQEEEKEYLQNLIS